MPSARFVFLVNGRGEQFEGAILLLVFRGRGPGFYGCHLFTLVSLFGIWIS